MAAAERIGVESYFGISDFTRNAGIYNNVLKNLEKTSAQYGKSVEKSTEVAEDSWEHYVRNLSKLVDVQQGEIDDLSKALKKFMDDNTKATKQAETSWEQFSKSMLGQVAKLTAAIAAVKFAARAVIEPFKQFMALGTEAVGLQRTRDIFSDMVGGVEEYTEAIEEMREVTKGTITDVQLMSSAMNIMRRGYADNAANAATLARNITLAGQAMGQVPTPEAAMQVFSLMMSNQSMMRMDAFVTNVDAVRARFEELKAAGMGVEEAFATAAIEGINREVEELGLTAETSVTKLNRMQTQFANLGDELKMLVLPLFEDFVGLVTSGAESITVNIDAIKHAFATVVGSIRGTAAVFGEAVMLFVNGGMAIKEALAGNVEAAEDFAEATFKSFERVRTLGPLADAITQEMDRMFQEVGDSAEDSADVQVQALDEVEQAWSDLQTAQQAYADDLAKVQAEAAKRAAQDARNEFFAIQDAAIEAARRREDIARETAARIQQIEATLASATTKAQTTYQQTIQNIEKQNADQRLQIERDFQKRKRDIMRNFAVSEEKAIRDRDALALSAARDTRDRELSEAEEQRNEQMNKANESMAAQTEAAKQALNEQLQAAQEAYQQQLAQLQQSLQEEEEERQRAEQRRLEDQQRADEREAGQRATAMGEKINAIFLSHQEELTMTQQHYDALTNELRAYYDNVAAYYMAIAQIQGTSMGVTAGTTAVVGGRQMGGYMATRGLYRGGETGREFAMNATTTRAMEKGLGGGITQMDLQALASTLGSGTAGKINVSGEITGVVNVAVREGIRGMEGRLMAGLNRTMKELFRVM